MNLKLFVLSCIFLIAGIKAEAQVENVKELIEQKIEELTENSDIEYDYTEMYDLLMEMYQNPLNLNEVTNEKLALIPFLNETQINNFIAYRKSKGNLLSLYELKNIDGFTLDLIYQILPFIKVEPIIERKKVKFSTALKYGKNEIFLRESRILEKQQGYQKVSDSVLLENPNAVYLGDPNRLYFKYRYIYKDLISIGLTADKDAGEEFFKGSNPSGFDFYSFHLYATDVWKFNTIAIGDYHLEFGQGLCLWTGLSFGKSASSIIGQKRARGIKASTSSNENLFLRGAAVNLNLIKSIDLTAFYSYNSVDANIEASGDSLNQEEYIFTSLQESGYHRTPAELADKHAIKIQVFGAHLQYRGNGLKVGLTSYYSGYDKAFLKNPSPYQYYDFQGSENMNSSVDFSYANSLISSFGELAISKNGAMAGLVGLYINAHSKVQLSLLYRNYSIHYQSTFASAFAESSKPQNEKGLFIGANLQIDARTTATMYYDLFRFPWLKFRVDAPSTGDEFSLQINRTETRFLSYLVRFKAETKQFNGSQTQGMNYLIPYYRKSLRFSLSYSVNKHLRLKSCVDNMWYKTEDKIQENGFAAYQDIKYNFTKPGISLSLRYAVFNTDSYDTRLYAYEDNVLYAFSVPAYYYKGQRYYLMASYNLSENIDLWVRFSQTIYANKSSLSSGLEAIDGNKKSEIVAQLRIKF